TRRTRWRNGARVSCARTTKSWTRLVFGAESFRKELLGQMKQQRGAEHYGAERAETVEAHAEGIVVEEMERRRWRENELGRRTKGDAGKVAMAVRLRAETAVT